MLNLLAAVNRDQLSYTKGGVGSPRLTYAALDDGSARGVRSADNLVLQWNGAVDEVSSADDTWVWDEAALTAALDRAVD